MEIFGDRLPLKEYADDWAELAWKECGLFKTEDLCKYVAEKENISQEKLCRYIAEGKVVIPKNKNRDTRRRNNMIKRFMTDTNCIKNIELKMLRK